MLVYPSKIDPHCEALVFVLSASDSDVSTMNLTTPDALQFNGHSAGEKKLSSLTAASAALEDSASPHALAICICMLSQLAHDLVELHLCTSAGTH